MSRKAKKQKNDNKKNATSSVEDDIIQNKSNNEKGIKPIVKKIYRLLFSWQTILGVLAILTFFGFDQYFKNNNNQNAELLNNYSLSQNTQIDNSIYLAKKVAEFPRFDFSNIDDSIVYNKGLKIFKNFQDSVIALANEYLILHEDLKSLNEGDKDFFAQRLQEDANILSQLELRRNDLWVMIGICVTMIDLDYPGKLVAIRPSDINKIHHSDSVRSSKLKPELEIIVSNPNNYRDNTKKLEKVLSSPEEAELFSDNFKLYLKLLTIMSEIINEY